MGTLSLSCCLGIGLLEVHVGFLYNIPQIYFNGLHLALVSDVPDLLLIKQSTGCVALSPLQSLPARHSVSVQMVFIIGRGRNIPQSKVSVTRAGLYTVVFCPAPISPSKCHLLGNSSFPFRCSWVGLFRVFLLCWPVRGLAM